ncbi:MAG: hypothetical protein WC986_11580 [Elusimicrobiota bacterium]|jgi:hypothetical protein
MNIFFIIIGIIALSIPVIIVLLREKRYYTPSSRWPSIAGNIGFAYQENPPRLQGRWKDREILISDEGTLIRVSAATKTSGSYRVEAGPKALLEKEAGMVVPDRVELQDARLSQALLARAYPAQAGQALDLTLLRKLAAFPEARLIGTPGKAELILNSSLSEANQLRQAADIVVCLADALDAL